MSATSGTISLEGRHWTYVVDFYSRSGVAPACLTLQDKAGVDVIMLLFSLYLLQRDGIALDATQIAALDRAIQPWRESVVVPLRLLRRRIKQRVADVPAEASEPLLGEVAQAAISSEQVALAVLASQKIPTVGRAAPADVRVLIDRVVGFYARTINADAADRAVLAAIETIASATRTDQQNT